MKTEKNNLSKTKKVNNKVSAMFLVNQAFDQLIRNKN